MNRRDLDAIRANNTPIPATPEQFNALQEAIGKVNATEYHGYPPGTLRLTDLDSSTEVDGILRVSWSATVVRPGSVKERADFHAFPRRDDPKD